MSAGGSGLVITCAALGLLRSACHFQHEEEREEKPVIPKPRRMPHAVTEAMWQRFTTG